MSQRRFTVGEIDKAAAQAFEEYMCQSGPNRKTVGCFLMDALEALPAPKEGDSLESGCPCLRTTPCGANCSCATDIFSGGCNRCCAYGSRDQQIAAAEHLAKIIDSAAPSSPAPEAFERKVWMLMEPKRDALGNPCINEDDRPIPGYKKEPFTVLYSKGHS